MVNTFHTREARSSTFPKSHIEIFFAIDICFALVGNYPAHIEIVLGSYCFKNLG